MKWPWAWLLLGHLDRAPDLLQFLGADFWWHVELGLPPVRTLWTFFVDGPRDLTTLPLARPPRFSHHRWAPTYWVFWWHRPRMDQKRDDRRPS